MSNAGFVFPHSRLRCGALLVCALSASAYAAAAENALGLFAAAELAVRQQPLLDALRAEQRAAQQLAVAAGELPDPQLFAGIRDLPVTSRDAYSLSNDSDTQLIVGVMQEVTLPSKRRLRSEQRHREGERLQAEQALTARMIRRDAALAWLSVWRHERAKALSEASLREEELQANALQIAVSTNRAQQSELVAAQVNAARLGDTVAARDQDAAQSRRQLSRWIGADASRPLAPALPVFAPPPPLHTLLMAVGSHPELDVLAARVTEAQVTSDLAAAAYKPDWRLELGYGHRREFSDMVMLQVGVDLPLFTRNRQDRGLSGALALHEAQQAQLEDGRRRLAADAAVVHGDLTRLAQRLHHYDDVILPTTAVAIDAALAALRSGRGALTQVIDARRLRLDVQLAELDLRYEAAQRHVQLLYLMPSEAEVPS